MKIEILYKNGWVDVLEEKDLDCSSLTVRGHASELIRQWKSGSTLVWPVDSYNAVALEEIVSVRVTPSQ